MGFRAFDSSYDPGMAAPTSRITVFRNDKRDVGDRQIVLSIDGQPLGTLLFGQQVSREVAPGRHRLRAHNTLFWKTIEVEIGPAEHASFIAINRAGFGTYSLLGLFGAAPLYMSFERLPDKPGAEGNARSGT
jgi:hypothetical protein